MNSTDRLARATTNTLTWFFELQRELNLANPSVKPAMLLLLEQQLNGLRVLSRDLIGGAPSRSAWSFGQAGAPVLEIVLQAVRRDGVVLANPAVVDQCRAGLAEFGSALTASAEGR